MLKFYTLRGRLTGKLYQATGHNLGHAARKLGIKPKDLIIERKEKLPVQIQFALTALDIPNEAPQTRL